MKHPDLPDPALWTPSAQPPVQLTLSWGEADADAEEEPPWQAPREQEPGPAAWVGRANAGRDQVIEAETRRVKMVCVGLLGLLLLALRFF